MARAASLAPPQPTLPLPPQRGPAVHPHACVGAPRAGLQAAGRAARPPPPTSSLLPPPPALAGYAVSRAAALDPASTVGICLVACCPGGVASNVVAFVARADVPLSVAMTTASTLGAIVATPFLASLLLGSTVAVDGGGMLASCVQVVLAPVAAGALLAAAAPAAVARIAPFAPLAAVVATIAVCGAVLARAAPTLAGAGAPVVAAVAALHALGFASGYGVSRGLKLPGGREGWGGAGRGWRGNATRPKPISHPPTPLPPTRNPVPHKLDRGRHAKLGPGRRPRAAPLSRARRRGGAVRRVGMRALPHRVSVGGLLEQKGTQGGGRGGGRRVTSVRAFPCRAPAYLPTLPPAAMADAPTAFLRLPAQPHVRWRKG